MGSNWGSGMVVGGGEGGDGWGNGGEGGVPLFPAVFCNPRAIITN